MMQQDNEKINQFDSKVELGKVYDCVENQIVRHENFVKNFLSLYNTEPQFISRAPGRVNLIGEHIDYEGFGVLPMAIENDILVAVNVKEINEDCGDANLAYLNINHQNNSHFKGRNFKTNGPIDFIKPHEWINYVLAGFNAIYESFLKEKKLKVNLNLLITGNVPFESGLSSSSALTVASALAFVRAFDMTETVSKNSLALATINYERKVGTACGGMDQTISIYAEKNQAKFIEFVPKLFAKSLSLPTSVSFVIANSLTKSPKVNTLAFRYNKRVVENKFALAMMCKRFGINVCTTLNEFKSSLGLSFKELYNTIDQNLTDDAYTYEKIVEELKCEEFTISLLKKIPYYEEVLKHNKEFFLRRRLVHVCNEAERVESFYDICTKAETLEENINVLGSLMNDSHSSCRDLYECSSPELDSIVKFALDNKAEGARLTGAGWGGCCVIMVRNENLDHLLKSMREYYINIGLPEVEHDLTYFKTKPSQGACILNCLR